MKKVGLYAGSFDPITLGHMDIVERALKVFDEIIILVAINPGKVSRFSIEERVEMIKGAIEELGLKNVKVDSYDGLTVDYAKKHNISHLIRGLRAVTDFEYEFQLASANEFADKNIDTLFLMSRQEKSFINSSMIMTLYHNGVDITGLVPNSVIKKLKK